MSLKSNSEEFSNMSKTKLIVVAGPTASGKTALAIELARRLSGEIISADSMQVYKGMSVATAAPTQDELEAAPHHLVEFLDKSESYSVSDFCDLAREKIDEITARGKLPIIAGGTGLFIDSLVDNIIFTPAKADAELRTRLLEKSGEELYEELLSVDREAALKIHKNNKTRVARALEIYYSSGETKTQQNINSRKEESPYDVLYFVIGYRDRALLYDRINRRVDIMLENGLLDEARENQNRLGTAAQAIGHKELAPYFDGSLSLDEAVDNLKQETRHYAKRQITWFKRRQGAVWLYADELGNALADEAEKISREFLNG